MSWVIHAEPPGATSFFMGCRTMGLHLPYPRGRIARLCLVLLPNPIQSVSTPPDHYEHGHSHRHCAALFLTFHFKSKLTCGIDTILTYLTVQILAPFLPTKISKSESSMNILIPRVFRPKTVASSLLQQEMSTLHAALVLVLDTHWLFTGY